MKKRIFSRHPGSLSGLCKNLVALLPIGLLLCAGGSGRAELVGHWTFEADSELVDLTGNWGELELRGATVADGHLNLGVSQWALAQDYTGPTIREKTLVVWVRMEDLNVRNGAPLAIDHPTADRFDAIVYAERAPLRWMPGSTGFQRTQDVMNFDESELDPELVQIAITYADENGNNSPEIVAYRDGEELGSYEKGPMVQWEGNGSDAAVLFGPRAFINGTAHGWIDCLLEEARLYDEAFDAAQIQALFAAGPGEPVDSDEDGLPDSWEEEHFDNLDQDAGGDPDQDGSNNGEEFLRRTDPNLNDTDEDGLDDGVETGTGEFTSASDTGTDPLDPDTDDDGLQDGVETGTGIFVDADDTGTDPHNPNTDGDLKSDGAEVEAGTDPNDVNDPGFLPTAEGLVGHWTFEPGEELQDRTGNWGALELRGATVADGHLNLGSNQWALAQDYTGPTIREKTLVAWLRMENLDVRNGAPLAIDHPSADRFDAIVYAERQVRRWVPGSSFFRRTEDVMTFDESIVDEPLGIAISYADADENNSPEVTMFRKVGEGETEEVGGYEKGPMVQWEGNGSDAAALFGPRAFIGGTAHGWIDCLVDEAWIYNRPLTLAEVEQVFAREPARILLDVTHDPDSGDLVLRWQSQGGRLYNVRSEIDPFSGAPIEWPIFDGRQDLAATPPENSVSFPLPDDPLRFFVVEEFPAPPVTIFSDDFESGLGDWTLGSDGGPGTAWELGEPTNVGPGAANSPTNCFGTNLSSDYAVDANVWLRSPPIDLGTAGGATLNYVQFFDIEEGFDSGRVAVLDAGDDSELAVLEATVDGVSSDWESAGMRLPAAALGKLVVIEFRLRTDDLQNFAGWYIDDVEVTVP